MADVPDDLRTVGPRAARDLIIVALSDVQRFIAESRTTADLWSASDIIGTLAADLASICAQRPGAEVVFPVVDHVDQTAVQQDGQGGGSTLGRAVAIPNQVVALVAPGTGADVAHRAVDKVRSLWDGWVRTTFGDYAETPGIPQVQWVCVPSDVGDYRGQWEIARRTLTARKRVRSFPFVEWTRRQLCAQSPRWPATAPPPKIREHEQDTLSAANWVKRQWRVTKQAAVAGASDESDLRDRIGFPSTSSVASAVYRKVACERLADQQVRSAVRALRHAVDQMDRSREVVVPGLAAVVTSTTEHDVAEWLAQAGGVWVYPDAWHPRRIEREYEERVRTSTDFTKLADEGRRAAESLARALQPARVPQKPAPYLALLASDLDGMGAFLSGDSEVRDPIDVTAESHRRISDLLSDLARRQRDILNSTDVMGVPVYTGGDDLLALVPAQTALTAARRCHDQVPEELPPTSTAVLFFHRMSSLRRALVEIRALLEEAKATSQRQHALGVGFLRRSGAREESVQPWHPLPDGATQWDGVTAAELFDLFGGGDGAAGRAPRSLSPRLVTELERDSGELASLAGGSADLRGLYRDEIRRLVHRHGGSADTATALIRLGEQERAATTTGTTRTPSRAARVAVFLRQECRPYATEAMHHQQPRNPGAEAA